MTAGNIAFSMRRSYACLLSAISSCFGVSHALATAVFPVQIGWNCEPWLYVEDGPSRGEAHNNFQIRWRIASDNKSVSFEAVARANEIHYVSFEAPSAENGARMIGSDAAVAYLSPDEGYVVRDYFITERKPCVKGVGVCPDSSPVGSKIVGDDQFSNVSGSRFGEIVRYSWTRPLIASDEKDLPIYSTERTSSVWSFGNLSDIDPNPASKEGKLSLPHHDNPYSLQLEIEFGRPVNATRCTELKQAPHDVAHFESEKDAAPAPWASRPVLPLDSDLDVWVTLGPSGGALGMELVSGKPSAGLIWYSGQDNTSLTAGATLGVVRGETYTFQIAGGPDRLFYITSSPYGGTENFESGNETVYSGPSTSGAKCALSIVENKSSDLSPFLHQTPPTSYAEFASDLSNPCSGIKEKEMGRLSWTVDLDTPDLVFYQSRYQAHMGWKIRVFDTLVENDAKNLDPYNVAKVRASSVIGSKPDKSSSSSNLPAECSAEFLKETITFQSCKKNIPGGSFQVYWSVDLDEGTITTLFSSEVEESGGWVAWGWSPTPQMVPGSAAIAFSDGTIVDHILASKYPEGATPGDGQGFLEPGLTEVRETGTTGLVVLGLYKRILNVDLEHGIWSIGALGDLTSNVQKHTLRGSVTVDLEEMGARE